MSEPSLAELEAERDRLYAQLSRVGDFRRGSVSENWRRCGKPNCACAAPDHPGPRLVALEDVVRDPGAPGLGQELGAEPDQAAGRDDEGEPNPAGPVVGHRLHPAPADRDKLGDRAEELLRHVDRESLIQ